MSFPSSAPIQPPSLTWAFPGCGRKQLSNGVKLVVLEQRRLPMVQVRLMIPGGRRLEGSAVPTGITSLAMRTSRYGTDSRDAAGLARALDALGSHLGCHASLDAVSFGLQTLSAHLSESFGVLADVVLRPRFAPEEILREATKMAAAKRQQASRPGGTSGQWIGRMLYGEHPYGWPSSTAEELLGIEPEQLSAYFREWVRPGDAVLVMAGDVSLDQATDLAEHHFGDWMGDAPTIVDPAPPTGPTGREILILDRPESRQSSILVGMKALARKHPSHLHLSMLNHIFGGGASGRLFKDLREERSLTYGCSAALDSGAWGGDIVAALSCSPEKTQEAMVALLGQVDRLCGEPVSQNELDDAIQYRVGAWPKAGSSLGGLSRLVLAQVLNSLPEDCWTRFPDELRALGVDALFEVAQTHLSAEDLAVVLVGDAAKLEPACAGLGSLHVRKVEALPPRKGHWAY